jgi:hypothetical protein
MSVRGNAGGHATVRSSAGKSCVRVPRFSIASSAGSQALVYIRGPSQVFRFQSIVPIQIPSLIGLAPTFDMKVIDICGEWDDLDKPDVSSDSYSEGRREST